MYPLLAPWTSFQSKEKVLFGNHSLYMLEEAYVKYMHAIGQMHLQQRCRVVLWHLPCKEAGFSVNSSGLMPTNADLGMFFLTVLS